MDLFAVSAKAVAALVAATFDPTLSLSITRNSLNSSEKKWVDRIVMMLRGAEAGELVVREREETFKEEGHGEDAEWDFEEPSNNSTNTRHTWTVEMMDDAFAHYRTGQKKRNKKMGMEGCRSLADMNKKFRWLKTEKDLRELVRYGMTGERPTNRNEQLRLLAEALDEEVTALNDAGTEFHDCNVKVMAIALNKKHDFWPKFAASEGWVRMWKEHYRVTSRHITKIVSIKQKRDEGKIKEKVEELCAHVQRIVEEHPDICIWNSDQTGMVKEAHGKRTLARKGVKKVECVAQSVGATTSSITLLPIIGADGYLKPKLFVQLGERGGKLPQKGCFNDPNLELAVATSHIMSKESAKQFYRNVLFSGFVPPKLLLILDSWPAFKDHDATRECAPPNCQLFIVNIPPGGTSMCQPADLSFNHQLKGIQRRLKSIVMARQIDYRVSQRDNLLKFVTQLHWCMGADRFKGFISYGFFKGGFTTTRPAPFESPKDFMFGDGSMAACDDCSSLGCNLCPRCDKPFCFECFWIQLHRC